MPVLAKAVDAAKHYGVSIPSVRKWAREGAIPVEKTPGGRYLYLLPESTPDMPEHDGQWSPNIVYARVSSRKQKEDLNRQARSLIVAYPGFTVIKDIGSGINYERKGFKTILERLFQGRVKRVVVAHQDRFSRFGYDFFEWLFNHFGAVLESVEHPNTTVGEDMVADIMEVFTVFTARYYGRRKYQEPKVKVLPKHRTKKSVP